ncbi:MAG: cyclopropane-fatty-acyl-phospholipid synthase family protein [Acidobacteriota bacterium]
MSLSTLARTTPIAPTGARDRLARRLVFSRLEKIAEGELSVHDGDTGEVCRFGHAAADGLSAELTVHDPRFYRELLSGGSLGAAEAYLGELWDTSDLVALVRVLARNRSALEGVESGLARLGAIPSRVRHLLNGNTRSGSRKNIVAHYDLGNEFFAAFLDPTMTYSSAYFETPETSLALAQRAKLDRICRKLQLTPDDHVLEIGTGWGSFAIHAASRYGCKVTTTTISPSQFEEASRRIARAGLSDRVELLLSDYRDLTGRYDKLASIEMIEAVGHEHLPEFFGRCGRLLHPEGLMALQAITIADRNYEASKHGVDFIQRYIFPGGAIPSVTAMQRAIASASPLTPMHLEEMGLHYADTLRQWRDNFEAAWPALSARFDERFRRTWNYYFSYCEGGFRERVIGVVQMLFAGPAFRREVARGAW